MLRISDGKSKKWKVLFAVTIWDEFFALGSFHWLWEGEAAWSSELFEENPAKQLDSKDRMDFDRGVLMGACPVE